LKRVLCGAVDCGFGCALSSFHPFSPSHLVVANASDRRLILFLLLRLSSSLSHAFASHYRQTRLPSLILLVSVLTQPRHPNAVCTQSPFSFFTSSRSLKAPIALGRLHPSSSGPRITARRLCALTIPVHSLDIPGLQRHALQTRPDSAHDIEYPLNLISA
jgi:hypothetical protein